MLGIGARKYATTTNIGYQTFQTTQAIRFKSSPIESANASANNTLISFLISTESSRDCLVSVIVLSNTAQTAIPTSTLMHILEIKTVTKCSNHEPGRVSKLQQSSE
eukprot:TRINITY_DN1403_c0_g1_i4.p2 TRINITY_DN1403_c0_g1~~TRINITY_DN1403_c0_g1_i4.p2  ORF type:complete len:106 (+),score=13.48 TRINITY_DN1403_c0_g1_i4:355-672(+)